MFERNAVDSDAFVGYHIVRYLATFKFADSLLSVPRDFGSHEKRSFKRNESDYRRIYAIE